MLKLPEYPWEALQPYRRRAAEHPESVADLSIGTPVDETPAIIQKALADASNAHGYPTTAGTLQLREAIVNWYQRRRNVSGLSTSAVIPSIGSKEFIAWLPLFLGLGPGDVIMRPTVAYPTYDIGAQLVGADAVAADSLEELDDETRAKVKLIWVNSPGNPTGRVDEVSVLKKHVTSAREIGAVLASDECYAELGWDEWETSVPSILDPAVCGADYSGLLSVYSLSKQSNLAGYRAAFAAGDEELISYLLNARKHAGMIVPAPIQHAMTIALNDDEHVARQKDLYRRRREILKPALEASGLVIEHSEAGLYLWCRSAHAAENPADRTEQDTWDLVGWMADLGIVVGPGVFYGTEGNGYIRVSTTASDDAINDAASRLRAATR